MRLKHVLAAIILVLSFAATVIAGPADDALDAFVNHDYATALTLFHRAADQGDANGFFMLGVMYATGQGIQQNYTEAAKWYRLATDQGNADAQYNLGGMYATGQGVQQDYVSAHLWLSLSAAQGEQSATKSRDLIARRMTPAQIAEAQRLAREWKPKR
jgi:TPR repeat protein